MRSKRLNLGAYDTDKIKSGYLDVYDPILVPWLDKEIKVLESDVYQGRPLELWRDYFPHVSVNRRTEAFFADGGRGSAPANWIEAGSNYEFRLYDSDHAELLTKSLLKEQRNNSLAKLPIGFLFPTQYVA